MTKLILLKDLGKELRKIEANIEKENDIALTRTLNEILRKEEKQIAQDVSNEYGITQGAVRSKTKRIKATRVNKAVGFHFASTRTNLIKPRQLKKGISHLARGKRRSKITTKIKAGSKPFLINAKVGGMTGGDDIKVSGAAKKIPVYRAAGFKRKVTTMKGSSIRQMVKSLEIDEKRLERRILRDFAPEYSRQLGKVKFRGRM